ncbi:protein-methionine-sulfoxide reductase catalytic subunit MsrP [Alcanivorax sp. DP30]|uniref:protein-methionine-sulfoxide reductase catalytic subunit MsrP n=1 Tax=Alcanivorax sp. DP30 TaxID=2606217 RepID=UPI001369E078|nr:protein-methionine-sulfoxide reductase catalytic subunit MsrP [Alcanivorax sp. DP30]MZR61382.1 protein-methionine-sulfoxide reductase catalytic subunit MsrP [Alcanivorax sp. DP30]
MIIRHKDPSAPKSHEITPESVYLKRRELMMLGGLAGLFSALPAWAREVEAVNEDASRPLWLKDQVARAVDGGPDSAEPLTPYGDVTGYNNFYEFGTGKTDPAENAHTLKTDPWSVTVAGEVETPGEYPLEDLLKGLELEERIYRLRCVEAWSMVIPWVGVPLASLLKKLGPTSKAKYVSFTSLADPKQMPGVRSPFTGIDWPYREGLRLDEAMHPLTLMAVGLYGRTLPNQNGAPFRLVVPWKYGFKSIKSIVRIEFTETMPATTWNMLAPDEYGFYANVNPAVDHPRWSQSRERRLPNSFFDPNWVPTRPFNGYGEVASLYKGMDLSKFY